MDPAFETINSQPENEIFRIVFFPDRIYHARYLNATRSERYRYNVLEVRGKHDIIVMRGEVYMDGGYLTNFIRIEYTGNRLQEQARETNRFLHSSVKVWLRVAGDQADLQGEALVDMHYCPWIRAFQVELWQTLDPVANAPHDIHVLPLLGKNGSITRVPQIDAALADIKGWKQLELAFREADTDELVGYRIQDKDAVWDNNFLRSHQAPVKPDSPSDPANTIDDKNYLLTFERAFYLHAKDVKPVLYRNAMTDQDNPERRDDNILGMRWLIQRELGGSLVYFHQVEIPPGVVEGTHRHIGSEELYFVIEGQGEIFMGDGDSSHPTIAELPTVERNIYGLGVRKCKVLPAVPGALLFTKSGGIHGIRNTSKTATLKFVAFGYQTS